VFYSEWLRATVFIPIWVVQPVAPLLCLSFLRMVYRLVPCCSSQVTCRGGRQ
jgi:hypothetical protein